MIHHLGDALKDLVDVLGLRNILIIVAFGVALYILQSYL